MSVVTVQAYTLSDFHGTGNITLRLVAPTSFIASDGTLVQGGDANFYRELSCTLSGTNLTIPQFTIDSTTDALNLIDRQLAGYSAFFYSNRSKLVSVFSNFQFFKVPPTPNPTTWPGIAIFSTPLPPLPIDLSSFYTKEQVNALLTTVGGVSPSRQVNTTGGIQGGGDLSVNRTHSLTDTHAEGTYNFMNATVDTKGRITAASTGLAVPTSRQVLTSGGLSGGGDLSANRTFTITDLSPSPAGTYTNLNAQINSKGQVIVASSGTGGSGSGPNLTLEQFGGGVGVDNLAAFTALKAYLASHSLRGATVHCGPGQYLWSAPIDHNLQLAFLGAGPSVSAAATQFYFYNGTTGVINRRVGENFDGLIGADGAIYEKICFNGEPSGFDGTCTTSGDTITRVSGPAFTSFPSGAVTVTVGGYDYRLVSVVDADHMTVGPSFMFVSVSGGTVGRETLFVFQPNLAGGQFTQYGGPTANITGVPDIGHITTDGSFGSGLTWGTVHYPGDQARGYIGTSGTTTWRMNSRHGFELHSRVTIRDCTVINFPGIGISGISNLPIVGASCNLNRTAIYDTRCAGNHGDGLLLIGNDSNACNIVGSDFSDNYMGYGVFDVSFLGNNYMSCHTIGNYLGSYYAGTSGLGHCTFTNCYAEDDQVGIFGNASVWVINGTMTRPDPRSIHNSWGVEASGNFLGAPLNIVVGQGINSSSYNGGGNHRNLISDTGTYVSVGSPAAEAGYPLGYTLALQGGYIAINANNGIHCGGVIFPDQNFSLNLKAGDPNTTDVPDGTWNTWKNTSTGAVKVWANVGGVMKSVALT